MHTYRSEPGNDPATWPIGDVTEWVYYPGTMALQTKKDAANLGAVYEYDPRGWLSKRTRARTYNGGALFTTYTRNRLGELKSIDHNDATPDVTITRDSFGHVISVTDGAGGWTFAYDAQDELEREVNTASGNALIMQRDRGGRRTGYSYWDQGAGKWATWGGYGYDPATARLTGVSTPEGWFSQSYEAGTSLPSVLIAGGIENIRTYDDLGRFDVMFTTSTIVGADADVQRIYSYNSAGQRQTMADENGDIWEYSYNGRNEVTGAVKKRGAATLPGRQHAYSFDAMGNRTQWGLYPSPSSRQYNSRNQATSGTNSNYFTVTGKADTSPTTTLTLNGQAITNRNGMDFAAPISAGGPYVPVWQSVNVTETKQGQAPTQTTGHVFQPRTTANVGHDADGNLIGDDRWNYTWDAENRLIKQETSWQGSGAVAGMPILRIEYKYDAYGRRVEKKISTLSGSSFQLTRVSKFAYDGWNLIAEWDSPLNQPTTLNLVRTHHWGLDVSGSLGRTGGVGALVLSRYHQANGQTTSCVPAYDGSGNVIALYDSATGKRAAEYEYGPFGELVRSTGPLSSANPFRFSTRYQDDQTGLLYYGYRYYSAETGRWIGRDPIGEAGGINLYGMVRNNPVNAVDTLGLETVTVPIYHYFWDSRYEGDENDPNSATGEGWSITQATVKLPDKATLADLGNAALQGAQNELKREWQAAKSECECLLDSFSRFIEAWNNAKIPSMDEIVSFAKNAAIEYAAGQLATIHRAIQEGKSIFYQNDERKAASAAGAYITKRVVEFVADRVGGPLLKKAKKEFPQCLKPRTSKLSDRVTKELSPGDRRTPKETRQARNYFKNNKEEAKRRREERTGEEWPEDATHMEHPRSLKEGGDPLYVEPGFDGPTSPHMVPGPDGKTDFQRWGAEGGRKPEQ